MTGQTSETTALPDFQIIVLPLSGSHLLQTVAELSSPEGTSTQSKASHNI